METQILDEYGLSEKTQNFLCDTSGTPFKLKYLPSQHSFYWHIWPTLNFFGLILSKQEYVLNSDILDILHTGY